MDKKQKGFVLPSTIVSILIMTLLSFLMISMVVTTTLSNKAFVKLSSSKITAENIFYNFKNQISSNSYSGGASLDLEDDSIETQTYTSVENSHISAIIATKNGNVLCFGVYDFEEETTICYQTSNYSYTITGEDVLQFDNLNFNKIV